MMRRYGPALVLAGILAGAILPGAAGAQGTPPGSTPTTPAGPTPGTTPPPAQAPVAPPAKGSLKLTILRTQPGAVLVRDRFTVRGVVRPYVAGQEIVVRISRGARRLAERRVVVVPAAGSAFGVVRVPFSTARAGALTIRAAHRATPAQRAFRAPSVKLAVEPYTAAPGARGRVVTALQTRLRRLGYVV